MWEAPGPTGGQAHGGSCAQNLLAGKFLQRAGPIRAITVTHDLGRQVSELPRALSILARAKLFNKPPLPYPGDPIAQLLEEKSRVPATPGCTSPAVMQPPPGMPLLPEDIGLPSYDASVQTTCPHCHQAITTKISYEVSLLNLRLGFFCCFMGCDLGCCLIPCLIRDFKDVKHRCPSCKIYIDTYKCLC
ncbi:cell death-inducing p53-target protein 1-like [Marmota marmota marmota]|uniref:cell death-inducing p53-target protein 1-like n=1 Tax=Marmota marmota marmota TaxID=9994 RepID=UPI002093346E|nr:cell death-inducing p53-target protein 1-like [Marmota marmota marmota]